MSEMLKADMLFALREVAQREGLMQVSQYSFFVIFCLDCAAHACLHTFVHVCASARARRAHTHEEQTK